MDKRIVAVVLAGACLSATGIVRSEILGDYLGYTACRPCHEKQVAGWKTTRHANAFENLRTQGAEKQTIPGCFGCHVVGFERDGGYIDMELTPELKDVQCEACHGPGRAHVEGGGDTARIIARPDEKSCRVCHTEGQDKNFDFVRKSKGLHGED
ncbi:MAG: multiheme c-type cytochrome [Thermodesulfobacteriota bacterium]